MIMKTSILVLSSLWLVMGASLLAQPTTPDVIAENLFTADLILKHQDTVGLVESQKVFFREEMEKSRARVAELQEKLSKEKAALVPLLKKDRIDEAAALAQSDKALALDQQIKREHLALLIRLKNRLTPDQQNKLSEIKASAARLQEKLHKVQEGAKQWQTDGKDLAPLQSLKDQFEAQMKAGNMKDDEATLDKTLKLLEGK